MEELIIYKEAQKIWTNTSLAGQVTDHSLFEQLDMQKKLLMLFHVGDFYHFIFNAKRAAFEYISPEMKTLLGYDPATIDIAFFVSIIHPDDQAWFLNFEHTVQHFFQQLPPDKVMKYKARYDFRVRHQDSRYMRILHQLVIFRNEPDSHLSLGVHTDITHLKSSGKPVLSFIGLDGEPSFINVEVKPVFVPSREILSRREKEILTALIEGKQSKEIGAILHISKDTVDQHRRNMLAKTGTSGTTQLVAKAIREGWI